MKNHKKLYWCVQTCYYTNGHVKTWLCNKKYSHRMPHGDYQKRRKCDVYEDWYDSKAKALRAMEISRNIRSGAIVSDECELAAIA